ncbi:carbamoyl phosphate synthase small subunit [Alkalicoccus saliphilus]|jgi:carbamoyl-phosphate synthase small subunit|uniref:Carbamoyl phosphate synthase small chain n=1 Tax=Alkalicoccus saliphilus TaxID=200989 RepID=A0A2T4U8H7_9BACI|nr:carbamoyl phosphate synthase small subunit [Alkalicoccus saliphilus]PTL39695.1 carbamoyl phosphate synthase small subunit [Alkalicoccus saliphilus]
MKRQLILENGVTFTGKALGAEAASTGEVVFNTSMTGYQEIFTDPSYKGQIVTMTYPLIGNYGINRDDFESVIPNIHGVVVKESARCPSHFRNEKSLDEWLKQTGIPGISGIDTRKLTKIIRAFGTLKGRICGMDEDPLKVVKDLKEMVLRNDQVEAVSTKSQFWHPGRNNDRVVLIDYGAKKGIVKDLLGRGFEVIVVPYNTPADKIMSLSPDGIMLSNGPGNPEDIDQVLPEIKKLAEKVPVFGICLGHQLLALAFGAETEKMKFGHRGGNHPVKHLVTGRVSITSQNHSYTVKAASLDKTPLKVTHVNVNDGSVEGLAHESLPVFSVQYHPEASPGPEDSKQLFDMFQQLVTEQRGITHA